MANILTDRNTNQRERLDFDFPVQAAQMIYKGTIVSLDTAGNASMHNFGGGRRAVGVALTQVNNTLGATAAQRVIVRQGCHKMANDGTINAQTIANNRSPVAYAVDNQTVGFAGNGSPYQANFVGYIRAVEPDGVWIDFGAV